MKTHNANNERMKRKYFAYLKEAKRYNEATVDAVVKALIRFETYNNYRDFKSFHIQQAIGFKKHLAEQRGEQSGKVLSKATLYSTLTQLKRFFQWLAGVPGYKSRISYADAEYFNLSEKETRIATAQRQQAFPTLEQIKHVISSMPTDTEIEKRDRALIAFTLLTGARDGAIASMKMKHVELRTRTVYHDAREVKTKFSKTFRTFFFPVGEEIVDIVEDWFRFLLEHKLWGDDDPLFPATRVVQGANRQFEASGLERAHWSTASTIRQIFRTAFAKAGLPYFNPHSFRNTLVRLGEQICKSPEEFKAWSQNLGHEKPLTTFLSYGEVPSQRQAEIMRNFATPPEPPRSDPDDIAEAVFKKLRDCGVGLNS